MKKIIAVFISLIATSSFAVTSLNCKVEAHKGLETKPRIDTFNFDDGLEVDSLIAWSPFSLSSIKPTKLVVTNVAVMRCPNCYDVVATDLSGSRDEFTFKLRGIPGSFSQVKIDVQWRYLGPGTPGKITSFSVKPGLCDLVNE